MRKMYGLLIGLVLVGVTASVSHALAGGGVTYDIQSIGGTSAGLIGIQLEAPFLSIPIPMTSTRIAYRTATIGTATVSPVTIEIAGKIPATPVYASANAGLVLISGISVPGPLTYGVKLGYEYGVAPTFSAFGEIGYQPASLSVTIPGTASSFSGLSYGVGFRLAL